MIAARLSRRRFLALALGATSASLLAACAAPAAQPTPPPVAQPTAAPTPAPKPTEAPKPAPTAPAATQAPAQPKTAFDWKQFRGESLFVLFNKHPYSDVVEKNLPEFEELTGMKVQFDDLPELQARQKLVVQFAAKDSGIDAYWSSFHVEKRRFSTSGWYVPLNDRLKNPKLTAPDFDYDDFGAAAKSYTTLADGSIAAFPVAIDPHVLFVNKELLAAKNVAIPTTLDEMEQAAKALHNPPQVYGFVARGLKNANTAIFAYYLFNFGGDWMDKDRRPTLNTPEAVEALTYYARMVRTYAPPGVENFNWYECSASFMQGQSAMYTDGIGFSPQFEDKEKSKVAGKVAYALFPKGPRAHTTGVFGSGFALGPYSKKQDPAYLFLQWATSKQNILRAALVGVGPTRASTFANPEYKSKTVMPPDWLKAFEDSMKIGRLGLPEIVAVTEFRDLVGIAITQAIQGEDPKKLLDQANKEFAELLEKTERA